MADKLKNNLRTWRLRNALTMQEVADLVGLSESMISLIERGKRRASTETKVRMARGLGVRIADLFEPDDD